MNEWMNEWKVENGVENKRDQRLCVCVCGGVIFSFYVLDLTLYMLYVKAERGLSRRRKETIEVEARDGRE